jgi:hypothetical protein
MFHLRRRRTERVPSAGAPIERRAVLIGGAAAAAGVAASQVAPVRAAVEQAAALPARIDAPSRAMQVVSSTTASEVSFVPTGEFDPASTNVQAALQELDGRLSKLHVIDDLQSSMVLVDDFMGGVPTSGAIGELGWVLNLGSPAIATLGASDAPGVLTLETGGSSSGWANINLGDGQLHGSPELTCEMRLAFSDVNTGTLVDPFRAYYGLHDGTSSAEPATGLYFRYRNSGTKTWEAVCANAGVRTAYDTGKDASTGPYVATNYHRFRIVCHPQPNTTTVEFSIDDTQVAYFTNDFTDLDPTHTHTSNLPSTNRYSPAVTIAKLFGATTRQLKLDYFALRYEQLRT